jgi:mRNA interferase RelE/StbE
MKFELAILAKVEKDMRAIPDADTKKLHAAILALRDGLKGDVKRLKNFTPEYRLRVGNWRVLFEVEEARIVICRILHRRDAYR